jgi:polysaccharide biosynthesis/export protein
MKRLNYLLLCFLSFVLCFVTSCATYRSHILFQLENKAKYDTLVVNHKNQQHNYLIQANDLLSVKVYTSKGEMLVDPEGKYSTDGITTVADNSPFYLVDIQGFVNLPMVGKVKVDSLSLPQADSLLAMVYATYYENCFVICASKNRRLTVFVGGKGQTVVIDNENTTLIEAIGMAGGISKDIKASNIRLIRKEGDKTKMAIIDLTTTDGIQLINTKVENHDVVYLEPKRKILNDVITDYGPIISFGTSILTLLLIITRR